MNDNVIQFPNKNNNPTNKQNNVEDLQKEIDANIMMAKHYHVQETIANITPIIFNHLDVFGFPLAEDDDDDLKDGALIVEAIRSMLLKYYEINHPFQIIASNIFQSDPDDELSLRIVDEINLVLKSEDDTGG
jgi:hypothetical protein